MMKMKKKLLLHNDGASTSKENQKAITLRSPSKKAVKRKKIVDDDLGQCFLRTRMSPKMFFTFINNNLSAQQVADIKDMGFGGLLNLKTDMVPGSLSHWLVTNFNTSSCSFMKGQLQITDEDIHLALGIPMGTIDVMIAPLTEKSTNFTEIKSRWLTQFNNEDPTRVDVKSILERMISQREGGEDFKRNFIVFIVSTFLMGVKGTCASLRVLKCLEDISAVSTLNWCKFTRQQFIEGVKNWKSSKNEYFGGPIMVFVFIYLDRVSFSYFSVPRVFPTLASWTKDDIKSRLKEEMKDGFGTGGVLSRIVKGTVHEVTFSVPSESNMPDAFIPEPKANEETKAGKSVEEDSKQSSVFSVKKLAEDANNLALAFSSFLKSLEEARVHWPHRKIVQQLGQIASALSDCQYSSQPNIPENKADESDKVKEKGAVCNEEDSEDLDPRTKFGKLKFENEDELWAALAKLEIALGKRPINETSNVMKKATHVKASHPIAGNSKAKSASPILLDSESQEFEPLNFEKKAKPSTSFRRSPRFKQPSPPRFTPPSLPLDADFTPPSFRLLSSESQSQEEEFKKFCDKVIDLGDEGQILEPLVVEPISSLPPKQPGPITRTMVKRKRVETQFFRSPYLQRSILVAGNLNKFEKDILEYVFSGLDESEILFQIPTHKLARGDLKTIVTGDIVPKALLHAWCFILNKNETRRAPSSPYRLYLPPGEDPCSAVIDDNFTNANLIFVPVLCHTPFAFCFNFITKKLEIIHVMKPKSVDYASRIQSTKQFLMDFLGRNKIPSIQDVERLVIDEYIPKSNLGEGVDSGIYLMRLLERYRGTRKGFLLGLNDDNQVKLFGARVCCQICCFDGNLLKNEVLSKARSMCLNMRFEAVDQDFQRRKQSQRKLTDTELIAVVTRSSKEIDLNESLVQTEWMDVCRKGMQSLQNCHWVMDLVLDMYGVMCTYDRPDILYLPSTVGLAATAKRELKPRNGNLVWCPHFKKACKPENGETINKVFFTIGKDSNHWLACVSDLDEQKNFILDSCKPNLTKKGATEQYNAYVEDIVFHFVSKLDTRNGYNHLKSIILFPSVNVDVPQQTNTFDCGLYVMKFLEGAIHNDKVWKDKDYFKDMVAYRREIMLKLLKWERNTAKVHF